MYVLMTQISDFAIPQYLLLLYSPDFQYWKESAIAPYMLEAAGENSSESEYFSCLSPPSKTLPTDEYGKTDGKVGLSLRQEVLLKC